MDYQILWIEISTDPLVRGYAGMTDIEIASSLNAEDRTADRTTITGAALLENTVLSELAARSAMEREAYWGLVNMGTLDAGSGTNTRTILSSLFPAASATRSNLVAYLQATEPVSRAEELGLPRIDTEAIETARSRYDGS